MAGGDDEVEDDDACGERSSAPKLYVELKGGATEVKDE